MKTFRAFAFDRFLETANLKIYNPTGGGRPTIQSDYISTIIHHVPHASALKILKDVGIQGRGGITKKNLPHFKRALLSHVANHSPELIKSIMNVNSPADFKMLVDYWRSLMPPQPKIQQQSNEPNDGSILPDEIGFNPGKSSEIKQNIGGHKIADQSIKRNKHGQLTTFPPVGSRLQDRLDWVLSFEKDGYYSLMGQIARILKKLKFNPPNLGLADRHWKILDHIATNGYRDIPEDKLQMYHHIEKLYNKNVISSLGNGDIPNEILAKVIDTLAQERIARLDAVELKFLAKLVLKLWVSGETIPKIPEEIIEKLNKDDLNRRYFGEMKEV